MTLIEQQVRQVRRRLWLNRWLRQWGWLLLCTIAAWTLIWIVDRLFALSLPMRGAALGGLIASLLGSVIWLALTRDSSSLAAAALDEAAGLRERISTGLHVQQSTQDPFARAVVADAEARMAGLSARKFIPVRWAGSLSLSALMLLVAFLSLLLPEFDILDNRAADAQAQSRQTRLRQARDAIAKPVSAIQKIAEKNPDLDLAEAMKLLDADLNREQETDPDVLRRTAVKHLDRLKDALNKKADEDRFKALEETKRRLKRIGEPSDPKSEVGRLMQAVSAGDFQEAQKAIGKLREQLAQRARGGKMDAKQLKQMQQQLNDLAKKLQQAAEDKQSERELKNAGLSEAEIKRVLDVLSKKDPKQLEKMAKELAERLKKQGYSEEQIKQMLKKVQQRRQASKQCNKMGSKMGQAAQQIAGGNMEGASEQLGEAGEMLSKMEQLEQAFGEVEAQLAQLDDAREDLSDQDYNPNQTCEQCGGTGFRKDGAPCPFCNGTGQCQSVGRGGGTRARDDNAQVDFELKKAKTKTRKGGRIIGQQFVKGQQLKGLSTVEFYDAAATAEIDAADALNKDRVPRIYRKGVRNYFDRLGKDLRPAATAPPSKQP